ncbi:MAG: superfamily [Bacteroidetes bacterium]|jgi:undecaprenyl-diphosphatase|nr:superfamily [Bacteroidota bacterium]
MRIRHLRPVGYARDLVRREFKLLVTILVIVASLWTFLVLANAVDGGAIQEFDDAVLVSLRQAGNQEVPRGPAWLSEVMRDVTSLGGGPVIFLVTLTVAIYVGLHRKYQALVLLLVTAVGGLLLELGLKEFFGRGRPSIVPHLMTVNSLSFPSGHSMMATVVYLVLAALLAPQVPDRRSRIFVIAVALLLTFVIGVSRVYLGVHYPSDVLGGWSVGLAWATLCWLASWYIERRRTARGSVNAVNELQE